MDLVTVADVAESVAEHGDRYLSRVYTEAELADCRTGDRVDATRLAARFAAKEATIKVLREFVPWSSIEVRRSPAGWVEIGLHGRAADSARAGGLSEFALSLTHEGGLASAVVVASYAPASRDGA
ncbi:MAG: holo-[acyl-carrier protein] synthase [Frankiaceae bacterium]|nr:holo-[acyl-carrier protein] synthase [Frankiaceae bacterium]